MRLAPASALLAALLGLASCAAPSGSPYSMGAAPGMPQGSGAARRRRGTPARAGRQPCRHPGAADRPLCGRRAPNSSMPPSSASAPPPRASLDVLDTGEHAARGGGGRAEGHRRGCRRHHRPAHRYGSLGRRAGQRSRPCRCPGPDLRFLRGPAGPLAARHHPGRAGSGAGAGGQRAGARPDRRPSCRKTRWATRWAAPCKARAAVADRSRPMSPGSFASMNEALRSAVRLWQPPRPD